MSVKYDAILEKAEETINTVKKEYKIGATGRVYYFASLILKGKKTSIPVFKFDSAKKPAGDDLKINVNKSEYCDMAERLIKYVKNNEQLPNYITLNGKKVRVRDYVYLYARLVKYFDKNNMLPSEILIDSSVFNNPNRKYGHAVKSGCDNMGQNTDYYCGVHSLQEVIRNLYNIIIPQSTLAKWAGTTTAGTSHVGLETAVAKFNKDHNKNLKVTWKNFSDLGWSGIKKIVDSKNQDCIIHNLYRNQWGHYEVINNVSSNITVQNSLGNYCSNGCHCGYIEYRTQNEFKNYINGISQKSIMILTRG
ncbi:pseudomurein-binding repeat-containing protein [Methanobrevibacter sp.]